MQQQQHVRREQQPDAAAAAQRRAAACPADDPGRAATASCRFRVRIVMISIAGGFWGLFRGAATSLGHLPVGSPRYISVGYGKGL